MSVLVWHYRHFSYVADQPTNFIKEQQPFYSILGPLYESGFFGVQIFWCISGFIFFWIYREEIASHAVSSWTFLVLRFSRLYPLHFVTLIVVLVLQAIYQSKAGYFFVFQNNDLPHFIYQLFLASNWSSGQGYSYNAPIWSISVEILVYGIFFFTVQRISKSFLINVAVLMFCFAAKYLQFKSPVLDCLAFFYVGGLSAIAFKYFQRTRILKHLMVPVLAALVIVPILTYVTNIYQYRFFSALFLLAYTPALLFVGAYPFNVPRPIQVAVQVAGNMTYSSYLLHFPIQLAIAICFLGRGEDIPYYNNVFFLVFMLATLVASYLSYRFFELPAQNYIRRIGLARTRKAIA